MMKGCLSVRNITRESEITNLLNGLCSQCYHPRNECKCDEVKPLSEVNRSGRYG